MQPIRILAVILTFAATTWAAAASDLIVGLHDLERVTLGNGLRMLVGRPTHAPLSSEVLLVVRAGTAIAPPGQNELARIAAQVLFAGRRSSTAVPIRRELAWLGVSTDFTVGREIAVFRFSRYRTVARPRFCSFWRICLRGSRTTPPGTKRSDCGHRMQPVRWLIPGSSVRRISVTWYGPTRTDRRSLGARLRWIVRCSSISGMAPTHHQT